MTSLSSVGSSQTRYQVPVTTTAKATDERTESAAVKAKEQATGKDAAVPTKNGVVNVMA